MTGRISSTVPGRNRRPTVVTTRGMQQRSTGTGAKKPRRRRRADGHAGPALPLRHPDTLISSDFAFAEPFVPSYERRNEKPNMFDLIAMEYGRMWADEMAVYTKRQLFGDVEKKREIQKKIHARHLRDIARIQAAKKPPPVPPEPRHAAADKYGHVKSRYMDAANGCRERRPSAAPNGRFG